MNRFQKVNISKDEWFVIGLITILAFVLIGLLPKIMNSRWFISLIPPLQYISFNFGFILLTIILFGMPTSYFLKQRIHILTMLRGGVSSWLIFSFMLDLWQPPFAFGPGGGQLILLPESLVGTSVDYMLGWTYIQIFPVQNVILNIPIIGKISLLFILIYFITPILAVLIVALVLRPGILLKLLKNKAT
ncbi:hypothetical protein KJ885_01620 [Patescibacteria group bacterium]|nr:hypothetical protein [Patescibacteria group bacterium]